MERDAGQTREWEAFTARCKACTACDLHLKRSHVVISRGSVPAPLLILGEGPGAEEDRQGLPFVGASGQLLTYLLVANGLDESLYHIANIVKCRPPGNRQPTPDEAEACRPLLNEQISQVKPACILMLGASAFHYLLNRRDSISRFRGQFFDYQGVPALASFHPAYILRDGRQRIHLWNDIGLIRQRLEGLGCCEPLHFQPIMPTDRPSCRAQAGKFQSAELPQRLS